MFKLGSTLFLKAAVILIGAAALALCVLLVPEIAEELTVDDPATSVYLAIIGCITVIPFLYALYQILRLLSYIDKNKAFSDLSVRALKYIKYSAITMSVMYVLIPNIGCRRCSRSHISRNGHCMCPIGGWKHI